MVVHEPAPTEAHVTEDIPSTDPIVVEDIGHKDNVEKEDDEVLPQLEPKPYHRLLLRAVN